jgi:hypothetical protein
LTREKLLLVEADGNNPNRGGVQQPHGTAAKGWEMAGRTPGWGRWLAPLVAGVALASCSLWPGPHDQSQPPPSPYAGTWQDRTGQPVPDGATGGRLVMVSYDGAAHCDWESVTFLQLAWPPGRVAPSDQAGNIRQYLRDPNGVLAELSAPGGFGRTALPADARDTGYRHGAYHLWVSRSDADRFVYVVGPDAVERWPRATQLIACA